MGLEEQVRLKLERALDELVVAGELPREIDVSKITVEPPRKGGSGDLATNAALVLAKPARKNPRALAESLARTLTADATIAGAEVAGPGFLNLTLEPTLFHDVLHEVALEGAAYGRARAAMRPRINVEFVSANPTGPLLISHGRGAIVGDAVARLFEAAGYRVTREYYINDFGNQVRLLATSVLAASRGEEPPEGGYGGFYVNDLSAWMKEHRPHLLSEASIDELKRQCIQLMLDGIPGERNLGIRPLLANLGIEFDVWSSEEALHRWGRVENLLDLLAARDKLRTGEDGAVYFVAGEDDEKDRVVKKSDGDFTYFASDIAYHHDKIERGFERLIDLWGADHHGYVARVRLGMEALGHDSARLDVRLFQLVKLVRDGKEVRMGKRLGNLITLQEVVEEIDEAVGNPHAGRDALRVFYLSRSMDQSIVLDVELAKKQEKENPVFYIQYGHARLCAIQRKAREKFGLDTPRFSHALVRHLTEPAELKLLGQLGRYPARVREAAELREPHKVIFYLNDLAKEFQRYYTQRYKARDTILPQDSDMAEDGWRERWDWNKTRARLLWVDAIRTVYASGLGLMGLSAPDRMARVTDEEEDGEEDEGAASAEPV